MRVGNKLILHDYTPVTAQIAAYYPQGSLVRALWEKQKEKIVVEFLRDLNVQIFESTIDRAGNYHPAFRVRLDYAFSTKNNVYVLLREKDDFYRQISMRAFCYKYPDVLWVRDYAKTLTILEQFG